MSKTCVIVATDRDFFSYTEIMLRSLDANYHGSEKLDVYVLVPERQRDWYFTTPYKNLNIELRVPEKLSDPQVIEVMETTYKFLRLSSASMFRYFAAETVPEYARALYLDSDILITRDIDPLLNYDLYGKPLAALPEIQLDYSDNPTFKDHPYFNSGIMVIDLKWWRNNRIGNKLVELSKTLKDWTGSGDQDVLNAFFRSNYTPLPLSFNFLINIFKNLPFKNPLIVHWAGKSKPWLSNSPDTEWKRLWKNYRMQGPTTM